jgi:hypothetical protein
MTLHHAPFLLLITDFINIKTIAKLRKDFAA